MTSPLPIRVDRSRAIRILLDAFIVALLVVFALDTLPCTPEPVRRAMEPLLDSSGLWQGTWSLFAPIPDARNHRLRADLYFVDGTHRVWNSPDWSSQSSWQRFVGHRHSEYFEKIWEDENSAAWPAFAQDLMRRERASMPSAPAPSQVALTVIWGDVAPPSADGWNRGHGPLDNERTFFRLIYPE
jgi:hypothetical protein